MTVLQSYLAGQWLGSQPGKPLASAINGEIVAHAHDDTPDFAAAVHYGGSSGPWANTPGEQFVLTGS